MITTKEIIDENKRMSDYFHRDKILDELYKNKESQNRFENKLIRLFDVSNKPLMDINSEEIKNILDNYFFDYESIVTIQSTMQRIFKPTGPAKYWFHDLKRIGEESVYGYALSTFLSKTADAFIIKTPRSIADDNLQHELVIGLYGLNALRRKVLNFAYVFGGFQCSPTVLKNKTVKSWCNNQHLPVNYVVYENITNSITLDQYVRTCSPKEFLDKFLQICLALHEANVECQFTHYDLHSQNVLVRNLNKKKSLRYKIGTKDLFINTDGLSTIIDYGQSHIKVKNRHIGEWFLGSTGTRPAAFPIFDTYKLLLFSMETMLRSRNLKTFELASEILRFFTTEDPREVIKNQRQFYFSLPYLPKLYKQSNLDLIKFIIRNINPKEYSFISFKPQYELLVCRKNECPVITDLPISDLYILDIYQSRKKPLVNLKQAKRNFIDRLEETFEKLSQTEKLAGSFKDQLISVADTYNLIQEIYFMRKIIISLVRKGYPVKDILRLFPINDIKKIQKTNRSNINKMYQRYLKDMEDPALFSSDLYQIEIPIIFNVFKSDLPE